MIHAPYATGATARLATSALPDAPVLSGRAPAAGRTRAAAATLLRRTADRLAPEGALLHAQ